MSAHHRASRCAAAAAVGAAASGVNDPDGVAFLQDSPPTDDQILE